MTDWQRPRPLPVTTFDFLRHTCLACVALLVEQSSKAQSEVNTGNNDSYFRTWCSFHVLIWVNSLKFRQRYFQMSVLIHPCPQISRFNFSPSISTLACRTLFSSTCAYYHYFAIFIFRSTIKIQELEEKHNFLLKSAVSPNSHQLPVLQKCQESSFEENLSEGSGSVCSMNNTLSEAPGLYSSPGVHGYQTISENL